MIPCPTLTDDRQELDAQHMVCSYLVRACRQAMYELALEDQSRAETRQRAIQVLRVVHQDWLEARKAIARELRAGSTPASTRSIATAPRAEAPKLWSEVK